MFQKEKEYDYQTVLWPRFLHKSFFHNGSTLSRFRRRVLACTSSVLFDPACRGDVSRWIHVAGEARTPCAAPRRRHRANSRAQEDSPRKRPNVSSAFPNLHFLRAQRHSEVSQVAFGLFLRCSRGYYSDRKTENILRVFICGLRKHDVLLDADRDIAHLINCFRLNTTEILCARKHDVYEFVQKRSTVLSAERHLIPYNVPRARLEGRDRFLRLARRRRLSRDTREAIYDKLATLLVFSRSHAR